VAPENAPDKIPTSVIPIWTIEKEPSGIRSELERDLCAAGLPLCEDFQPCRTGGYDRGFGHRQQAVDDDQNNNDGKFED
jgi:hypothetical protein